MTATVFDVGRFASPASNAVRRFGSQPGLLIACAVLLLVIGWAVLPELFTDQSPVEGVAAARFASPDWQHLFGTDELGRDLYSRVVYGASLSLRAAAIAIVLAFVTGTAVGLVAGFFGGAVDAVTMRVVEMLLSIPPMLMSLVLISALGFGTLNVGIAVAMSSVAVVTRLMRAEVLRVRTAVHVEGAIVCGARWPRILLRYILPAAVGPVLALAALDFGLVVLAVSSLSFLGFGEPPPAPEWGALVAAGRNYMATAWWLTALPGLTVAVLVLSTTRLARALESGKSIR